MPGQRASLGSVGGKIADDRRQHQHGRYPTDGLGVGDKVESHHHQRQASQHAAHDVVPGTLSADFPFGIECTPAAIADVDENQAQPEENHVGQAAQGPDVVVQADVAVGQWGTGLEAFVEAHDHGP